MKALSAWQTLLKTLSELQPYKGGDAHEWLLSGYHAGLVTRSEIGYLGRRTKEYILAAITPPEQKVGA